MQWQCNGATCSTQVILFFFFQTASKHKENRKHATQMCPISVTKNNLPHMLWISFYISNVVFAAGLLSSAGVCIDISMIVSDDFDDD